MISIIIANWNGKKWLEGCFSSIFRQTYPEYELILVDNGSSDGSAEFVQQNYPEVKIIRNQTNLGFGKANNIGSKDAKGDILFFLNNDTILQEDTIEKLLECKNKNKLNITGPKIFDFEKKDVYQGKKLAIDFTGYLGWGKETFYIEGCALMISKKDFDELGGFDEKYFMYSEDIDLCWRAWLFGMKVEACEAANLVHFGGGSSEPTRLADGKKRHQVPVFRKYEVEKNNLRNLLKNYRWFNLMWTLPIFLGQDFFEAALYIVTGNFKPFRAVWGAIGWNLANIGDTMQHRRRVQKSRRVGDSEIFSKMNFRLNKWRTFLAVGIPKFK